METKYTKYPLNYYIYHHITDDHSDEDIQNTFTFIKEFQDFLFTNGFGSMIFVNCRPESICKINLYGIKNMYNSYICPNSGFVWYNRCLFNMSKWKLINILKVDFTVQEFFELTNELNSLYECDFFEFRTSDELTKQIKKPFNAPTRLLERLKLSRSTGSPLKYQSSSIEELEDEEENKLTPAESGESIVSTLPLMEKCSLI